MPKSETYDRPPLCFQDAMKEWKKKKKKKDCLKKSREYGEGIDDPNDSDYDDDVDDDDVANVFFELANSTYVSYRLPKKKKKKKKDKKKETTATTSTTTIRNKIGNERNTYISIQQDINACGKHTGGIVWETSYLLLEYLRYSNLEKSACCCKNFLEVGAGCGLIGLGVYKMNIATQNVYVTETSDVMPNLIENVKRNTTNNDNDNNDDDDNDYNDNIKNKNNKQQQQQQQQHSSSLHTCVLDWTQYKQDCQKANIRPHSIDTIVGTDVVFCQELVKPLLATIRYLAHSKTLILLCLQERCKDSYELLFTVANEYEIQVEDVTKQCFGLKNSCDAAGGGGGGGGGDSDSTIPNVPECTWGNDLECKLLKLSVVVTTQASSSSKSSSKMKKKKKRKRERTSS